MSRRLGTVLMVSGVLAAVIGVVGLMGNDGDGDGEASGPAATTATTAKPTTTISAATAEELVTAFYEAFGEAFREAATDFLFDRLHPAVLDLYGEDQCREFVEKVPDNRSFEILKIYEPGPWNYGEREDREIVIEDAVRVDVIQRIDERETQLDSHLAIVDGEVRWFTDCGNALPA